MKVAVLSFAHVHAASYLRLLSRMPGIDVLGSDPDTDLAAPGEVRGRAVADAAHVAYADTYDEAFAWGPDAVIVCSENVRHRPLVERAAVDDLAEHHVLAVQPRRHDRGDEELGAVGVLAGVGHGQQERAVVLELEVLVGELLSVDALAAGAVAAGEVTALEHELRDDPVEAGALVAEAVLAGGQLAEVLRRLGNDVVVQLEDDAPGSVAVNGDVEENVGRHKDILSWLRPCPGHPWAGRP